MISSLNSQRMRRNLIHCCKQSGSAATCSGCPTTSNLQMENNKMKNIVGKILIVTSMCLATMIAEAHSEHGHHQSENIELSDRDSKLNEVTLLMDKAQHGNKEDYYSQAAKLLDKLKYSSVQSRLYKAEIQQYFHQFDEAVSTLSSNQHDPATSLMRASIYFTQGKMTLAQQECKNIFGKVDNLLAITCMAQANSLLGELDKGYQVLTAAIKHVSTDDKQSHAWAYVTLAEMSERRFDRETAKSYYLKALTLNKNDFPSRIAFADLLLEEKKYQQVLSLT